MFGKGGSGKTTAAVQFAGVAAYLGYRVLILDADPQLSASAWRSLRANDFIAVHSCRPEQVDELLKRAQSAGVDLVLIDNAPNWNSSSPRIAASSDLSIVMVRPATFDLVVGLRWVGWLNKLGLHFVAVIGAAPPRRLEQESPLVRNARKSLLGVGGRVWKQQITSRHSVVESVAAGRTLMEMDPVGAAAGDYCRLWNAITGKLQKGL